MTLLSNNRTKKYSEELDNMSNQVNENMEDSCLETLDEKRIRKAVFRRTIDYNSSVTLFQEQRLLRRLYAPRNALQPDMQYQHLLTPPQDYKDNPMNCVCVKHVRTSTNKNKCPIYSVCWTPDGRRLITAASSGEFTLWNGLTFNFETILQAHDTYIKAMKWSHNEDWLLSGDDLGMVKYWQANMNDVNVFQAHKDAIRGLSFCPSDKKFVTCSVDNTVRIWDFQLCKEERVLRGHGGEVKCVAWHPTKALVLSGSKDSQQPLKIWDPKAGECISTMYVHKSSCNDIAINKNGNWFLSASKDHTIKLFDLRNLKTEMQVFRGHKKDVFRVAWNPFHENLFASGSGDGALMYWMAGTDMEVGSVDDAHDNIIWSIDWHPMGHILATGSNDFATKFWTRNRPGDVLKDNQQVDHNISTASRTAAVEANQSTDAELEKIIKRVKKENALEELDLQKLSSSIEADLEKSEKLISDIPGLSEGLTKDIDVDTGDEDADEREAKLRGSSYRVIPKQFVLNWADKKKHPAAYIPSDPPRPLIVVLPKSADAPDRSPDNPQAQSSRHLNPPTSGSSSSTTSKAGKFDSMDNPAPKQYSERPLPLMSLVPINPLLHQKNPPPTQRRQSPEPINRFPKLEPNDRNETPPSINHNGQNFQRNFRPPRPFNRRPRDFTDEGEEEDVVVEDGFCDEDEEFMDRRPTMYETTEHRPRFPLPGGQRLMARNVHPGHPDFMFERQHLRPHPRNFNANCRDGSFRVPGNPNQRMFPPNHPENRFEFQFQRPQSRNFSPGHQERPFLPVPPHQRPLLRSFRPPGPPGQFDSPQYPGPRGPPRHFHPPDNNHQFHQPGHQRPPSTVPRNFHPIQPGTQFEPPHPRPPQQQAPPRNFLPNNPENPFEPQKSTGSSKAFIPLPFNSDEPINKRIRPNLPNRPGPNW